MQKNKYYKKIINSCPSHSSSPLENSFCTRWCFQRFPPLFQLLFPPSCLPLSTQSVFLPRLSPIGFCFHDFIIVFFLNTEFHNIKTNFGWLQTFNETCDNLIIIVKKWKWLPNKFSGWFQMFLIPIDVQ